MTLHGASKRYLSWSSHGYQSNQSPAPSQCGQAGHLPQLRCHVGVHAQRRKGRLFQRLHRRAGLLPIYSLPAMQQAGPCLIMGVFHALKWANIDFQDRDELAQLPRDLLDSWLMECLKYTNHPRIKQLKPDADHWILARNVKLWFIMDQPNSLQRSPILEQMITRQFNHILHRKIREYED